MLSITINDQVVSFDLSSPKCGINASTTLNDVIRNHTPFTGTKVACNEGGCGACTVALTYVDPATGKTLTRGINSCLAPAMSLNGMSVTTTEGIGNLQAPHAIQKKLADMNGAQCGYCSSGMVMAMYSHLAEHPNSTAAQIESMLDGNLCRCTGYRPILEAFRSFAAVDDHQCDKEKCCKKLDGLPIEVEEAARTLLAGQGDVAQRGATKEAVLEASAAAPQRALLSRPRSALTGKGQVQWVDVEEESQLLVWLNQLSGVNVMLVVGGTSQALDRVDYDVYLNVRRIPAFNSISQDDTGITIGAAVTFTDAIKYLERAVSPVTGAADPAIVQLRNHFLRVASTLIRNRACVAGNLIYTHRHQSQGNAFPSDAAIALMGIGATVKVVTASTGTLSSLSLTEFFAANLQGSYVKSIHVPWSTVNETFRSYKIALRQTLDHAVVNAAMKAVVDPTTGCVVGEPIIAVGGLFPVPTRLTAVEATLVGRDVTKPATLETVCRVFSNALSTITAAPLHGSLDAKKQTALNFLYKFILALQPTPLPAHLASASDVWMPRAVSQAKHVFGTDEAKHPVTLPIPRTDGLALTTGQAVYVADIPTPTGCVFGALVTTSVANAAITAVNVAFAKKTPGFVAYLDAKSIPDAANNWIMFGQAITPIFANGTSLWAGQVVGCVLATTEAVARECAELIESTITYGPTGSIVVDVKRAADPSLNQEPFPGASPTVSCGDVAAVESEIALTASGTVNIKPQYHFHLENHPVLVRPIEGQLVVDLASQAPSHAQLSICLATGLPATDVIVRTRRCGGAYGAKIFFPSYTSSIAAIAAQQLQKPVRLNLSFKDGMRIAGCRPDYNLSYTMGLKADGSIVSLKAHVDGAAGVKGVAPPEIATVLGNLDNCYRLRNAAFTSATYRTDVAPSAPTRGPGWIQAVAFAEVMMNQVAAQTGIPAHVLRERNLYQNGDATPNGLEITGPSIGVLWSRMLPIFEERKKTVAAFNAANTFVKRGVSINPTRFDVGWICPFNSLVSVYYDGSISIVHGGTEIGQGINTKVAQAVALKFGLTAEDVQKFIKIQPTTTAVCSSLGNITGASVTSEVCVLAVMNACDTINERLAKLRTSPTQPWREVIGAAVQNGVDLVATGYSTIVNPPASPGPVKYHSWGCAVTEVEVDTLTGQFQIKQTDLLFDCGVSMNPAIDIGQVEGGFMYGVGWFTSEVVQWDKTTGEASMAGTWRYKPPGARDLPEVFNVTLLENSHNTVGVLGSKAVGEPPLALGISVLLAIEDAINTVRSQTGQAPFTVTTVPMTVNDIAAACAVTSKDFVLH